MVAPFAAAWGLATQAVGDGALENVLLVAQCPDTAPVIRGYLREAEKSAINHTKTKLTWDLLALEKSCCGKALYEECPCNGGVRMF